MAPDPSNQGATAGRYKGATEMQRVVAQAVERERKFYQRKRENVFVLRKVLFWEVRRREIFFLALRAGLAAFVSPGSSFR